MISEAKCSQAIDEYSDMVRKICFLHLKNEADTQDVFQNVFFKYACHDAPFDNKEHEKAWLIRVTINECNNIHKSFFKKSVSIDEFHNLSDQFSFPDTDLVEAVLRLPKKYREAIYLHYYEGYSAPEISSIVGRKTNSIYSDLKRGRELLKKELGDDYL